jgi:hypothetical protein
MASFVPTFAGTYYLQVVVTDSSNGTTFEVAPFVDPALATTISG